MLFTLIHDCIQGGSKMTKAEFVDKLAEKGKITKKQAQKPSN